MIKITSSIIENIKEFDLIESIFTDNSNVLHINTEKSAEDVIKYKWIDNRFLGIIQDNILNTLPIELDNDIKPLGLLETEL